LKESSVAASAASLHVRLAESHDAVGAFNEAIKHLVAGTHERDVEATTRLGKRLLVGDRAPFLPKDGANLIADASALGGAEAAALLAVLYALGTSPKHDVAAALECLILAAERGWSQAQAQISVLAAGPLGGAPQASVGIPDGDPRRWRELGRRVDLAAWHAVPPSTDLSASPLIRSYDTFVGEPVCRWLIERSRGRLSRALVYEALSKEVTVKPSRTNTAAVFNMLDTDLVFVLMQRRMAACLQVPLRQFEAATVLHYDEGEEITEHYDFVDPQVPNYQQEIAQRGDRLVTFLIYLNEDYGAGQTAFPRLGIDHKGKRGGALFFVNARPDLGADTRTLHAGRAPVSGEKWIVSQFVRDRFVF
jgi:prolyl 4-hydroxylase